MKEIIMIIDDVEFPYGKYPYNTAEERRCTDIIASEVARERRCKVYLKEVPEDDKSR